MARNAFFCILGCYRIILRWRLLEKNIEGEDCKKMYFSVLHVASFQGGMNWGIIIIIWGKKNHRKCRLQNVPFFHIAWCCHVGSEGDEGYSRKNTR